MEDLLEIMRILRKACPWDREQTHESIRMNFIEETYEAIEAIDTQDADLLQEELGDVLLQVVFHAQMEAEAGRFDFADVCDAICQKLIVRHPHVFSDRKADTVSQVLTNWDAIKMEQKGQTQVSETLDSVAKSLPALMRSQKVLKRAAKAGVDVPDAAAATAQTVQLAGALQEAVAAGEAQKAQMLLGTLLLSCTGVARQLHTEAEYALTKACESFVSAFAAAERKAAETGAPLDATMETLFAGECDVI